MLFSCLVDADFLETERFYAAADGASIPRGQHTPLADLLDRLRPYQAGRPLEPTPLNLLRAEVLSHAVAKAALPPGLFTLTVPTGGGKTLTSLRFALEHALRHGLRRVVYVIPYTSIIEQTAEVFRTVLGSASDVLEHHASFDWESAGQRLTDKGSEQDGGNGQDGLAALRRATENWDAPVFVTTAVQFFESLHAARTSRCRKLHNLAGSMIVLDEAQTMPLGLLQPCLAALDELCLNYRANSDWENKCPLASGCSCVVTAPVFTRPEMKVERVSYDMLTPSAARGILEAIHWKPAIRWVVDRIHVLRPIRFQSFRRNEVGAKMSASLAARGMRVGSVAGLGLSVEDERQQRAATLLRDVEYLIEAHFEMTGKAGAEDSEAKHLAMFNRRAAAGQCFHRPCLGTREFPAEFDLLPLGAPPPPSLLPPDQRDRDLGWMLHDIDFLAGRTSRFFRARLAGGILDVQGCLQEDTAS